MSGIKENQEIRRVRRVRPVSLTPTESVVLNIVKSTVIPTISKSELSSTVEMLAPHLIKAAFKKVEKGKTLAEVREKAMSVATRVLPEVVFSSATPAKQVTTLVEKIRTAQTAQEIKNACVQIKSTCVKEQEPVFIESITTTVQTVMNKVGFVDQKIKTINSVPVVIAKNSKGQAIRTEITEAADGSIDLVRKQSGITDSECDALNEKINSCFQQHGLEYARFSKISNAHTQHRILNLSEENDVEQNDQTTHLNIDSHE